ncbi:hypothetical protein QQ045_003253 [Rhodiola kirilowii]
MNSINQVSLGDGSVSTDNGVIKQEFSDYFKDLLGQARSCSSVNAEMIAQGPVVNSMQCRVLVRGATDKEIWSALSSIGSDRAPGPDGFSASFFKKNWSTLGKELCDSVRHCLRYNALPKGTNSAYITLIPKISQASKPEDFRPISCCNVTYKIISSLLASRLKEVLPDIIDTAQGAFVKDRSIVGNICLAQQLLSGYGRKSVSERMAWKIDLRKAYDTIDWSFLTAMLENLKFPFKFIAWLVMCFQSSTYSVMINGELVDYFQGKRGLRQGDPLSPFLFTIAMECLSRMLKRLSKSDGFYYHPKCHRTKLSHIMFADDLILFSSGRNSAISAVRKVVSDFLECSGLSINLQKSHMFTGGMNDSKIAWVEEVIGTKASPLPVRYLGIPLTSRSLSRKDCAILTERMTARLNCWSNRFLSRAGRSVLVVAVLQAMVYFWARVCILPKSVIQAVNSMCAKFLWRGNCDKKGGHLVQWSVVCRDKEEGGLGVKILEAMNYAMVINQMWGKKEGRPTLWSEWLEQYWTKGKHWWEEDVKANSSWILKRMMQCKDIGLKCVTVSNNTVKWRGQGEGFGVSDTYNLLTDHKEKVEWYYLVWNDYNAPRDSMNAWLVVQNKLMTRDRMGQWGWQGDKVCVLCDVMDESRDHIFFDCRFSREVWLKVMQFLSIMPSFTCWDSLIPWFKGMPQRRLRTKLIAAATTRVMNGLWRARNSKIFKTERISADQIVQESVQYLKMKIGAIKKEACPKEDLLWLKFMRFID